MLASLEVCPPFKTTVNFVKSFLEGIFPPLLIRPQTGNTGVESLPPTLRLSLKEQSQAGVRVDFLFEMVRNFPANLARKKAEDLERERRRKYRY